jgi:hypothetical protein
VSRALFLGLLLLGGCTTESNRHTCTVLMRNAQTHADTMRVLWTQVYALSSPCAALLP